MPLQLFSMKDCEFCEKTKEKLKILRLAYEEKDLEERTKFRPGWRDDGSVDFLVALAMADGRPPVLEVNGEFHGGYSRAMSVAKGLGDEFRDESGDELHEELTAELGNELSGVKGSGPAGSAARPSSPKSGRENADGARAMRDEVRAPSLEDLGNSGERLH